ncbi:MAG: ribonuclease III [Elusimicrobia bacterium]|nr:ribonuclease III [Candidatus Liberimonas magnetica]
MDNLKQLEGIIGFKFQNRDLLKKALTHKSFPSDSGLSHDNERMEFLGDSILATFVVDYLYNKYPEKDEGKLSQLKSQIVSQASLSRWAKGIKLGDFIYMSPGEEATGGRKRDSLMSDTFEALIASIYLDGGLESAKKFILNFLINQKRLVVSDTKSKLQEYFQLKYKILPEYKVLRESGPDHEKIFEVGVYLKKTLLGEGKGHSKKEAEQSAARSALKKIRSKKQVRPPKAA